MLVSCTVGIAHAQTDQQHPERGATLKLMAVEDDNATADRWSDGLMVGSIALGALAAAGLPASLSAGDTGRYRLSPTTDIGLALAVNNLVTYGLKAGVGRARPYTFSPNYPSGSGVAYGDADVADAFHSFPSGHTSNTAAVLFAVATTAATHWPRAESQPSLMMGLYGVAATTTCAVAWARVRGGRHFVTDVIAGGLIGGVSGIAIPLLTRYWSE